MLRPSVCNSALVRRPAPSEASIVLVRMIVLMMVMMIVGLRTGGVFHNSTTRLAVVAAAVLTQDHATPQVARQLVQLFGQRHGLVQVGQEVTEISFGHLVSLCPMLTDLTRARRGTRWSRYALKSGLLDQRRAPSA